MNNYKHTVNAFCELYNMLCAIALAVLIATYLPQFPLASVPLTIQNLINCIILIFLVVRFFHGNFVFVKKCHLDEKDVIPVCMYIDLTFMLLQGLLLIVISLIGIENVYYVVTTLIFTDALWMGLVLCIKIHPCPQIMPYALKWMVSNLFTTCIILIFILCMDKGLVLNIINMVIIFVNTIINFYMNNAFLRAESECEDINV